eukprot:COSAG05_NODE_1873_length_3917_cov_3.587742_3_plen_435_part_00
MAEPEPGTPTAQSNDENTGLDIEAKAKADEIKAQANAAFAAQRFTESIELYTQAIDMFATAPLYSNRAFAHIKVESLGSAIEDAEMAIRLDRKFIKGYYRKGTALAGLGKHKQAKKQFENVVKLQPKNKDARAKVKALDKTLKELAFAKAIESDGNPFELVDFGSIDIETGYCGPHFPDDIGLLTPQTIDAMTDAFKVGKMLHRKYMIQLLSAAKNVLQELPSLVEIKIPAGGHLTVCGDTHGQFFDLMNIFAINGPPTAANPYLFNGDFVDRGSWSVEVILTLLAYKVMDPESIHLNRGNHETLNMNRVYGFTGEVKAKFNEKACRLFTELFCTLPLGHVIGGVAGPKVMVVHGGLFSQDGVKLSDIRAIDRFREPPEEGLMSEMLWSDPQKPLGRGPSKRGVGVAFGPDVAARFLGASSERFLAASVSLIVL